MLGCVIGEYCKFVPEIATTNGDATDATYGGLAGEQGRQSMKIMETIVAKLDPKTLELHLGMLDSFASEAMTILRDRQCKRCMPIALLNKFWIRISLMTTRHAHMNMTSSRARALSRTTFMMLKQISDNPATWTITHMCICMRSHGDLGKDVSRYIRVCNVNAPNVKVSRETEPLDV